MTTEHTKLVRTGTERARVALTADVASLGFQRTKKVFWSRVHEHSADVLHIHRDGVSYGAQHNASVGFRLHLAIRVMNDPFPVIALNGPSSDMAARESRYHSNADNEAAHLNADTLTDEASRKDAEQNPAEETYYPSR